MHRSEARELIPCSVCGAETSVQDRAYAFGETGVLCYACAIDRQGEYDENRGDWAVAPYLTNVVSVGAGEEP
jgi:hypothetical protein